MQIPNSLAEQLKLYLKQRAEKGDSEAQALSAQLEQVASSPLTEVEQAMYSLPTDESALGC